MQKYHYARKAIILLLLSYCCSMHTVSAHEGHDPSQDTVITIGKKTFVHLQSALLVYEDIYNHLIKKELNGLTDLAQKLANAARQGIQTEPKGPGQHMMQHILAGAEDLRKAKGIQETQKAFTSISDALLPFFKFWPNQLKRNELKMCQCKNDGHCWLQLQNCPPVCPYSTDQTKICSDIEEIKQ